MSIDVQDPPLVKVLEVTGGGALIFLTLGVLGNTDGTGLLDLPWEWYRGRRVYTNEVAGSSFNE